MNVMMIPSSSNNQPPSALNSRLANIEQYLLGVERDMNELASEEELWKEEHKEWQQMALGDIERVEGKLKAELMTIQKEIKRRQIRSQEAVACIDARIRSIQQVQRQCRFLVEQLYRRLSVVEEVLGGN